MLDLNLDILYKIFIHNFHNRHIALNLDKQGCIRKYDIKSKPFLMSPNLMPNKGLNQNYIPLYFNGNRELFQKLSNFEAVYKYII